MNKVDPIGSELVYTLLYDNLKFHLILLYHEKEADKYGKHSTLYSMNSSKVADYITPEELSNNLHIGLKTAARSLKDTTSQLIHSTAYLTLWFRTDKTHLRYKQLAKVFGSFYTDYL